MYVERHRADRADIIEGHAVEGCAKDAMTAEPVRSTGRGGAKIEAYGTRR
jgi:hypothetical protein